MLGLRDNRVSSSSCKCLALSACNHLATKRDVSALQVGVGLMLVMRLCRKSEVDLVLF